MAQVYPFRAFRYDPARAPFDRVLTQPYDKISPAMQGKYYAADPHNLIVVEKGRAYPGDTPQNNVYTRAAAAIEDWIRRNVVVQDPAPSFYAYTQEYTTPGTEKRRARRGFIGAGKLEEYSAGVVFRHEHTLSGPKADRLELLRHTKTHTGQLFMLYSDAQRRIDAILADAEAAAPAAELRDEYGVVHRLWVIADPQRVAAIQKAMEDQKLVIADGHHRYETALNYRNECRTHSDRSFPNAFCIRSGSSSLRDGAELPERMQNAFGKDRSECAVRARHDDVHQHAKRGADDFADAPRGDARSRFFLDQRAAASRAVVCGGGISVLGQRREVRGEKEVSCETHERARETGDRSLSRRGSAEAGVLRADAAGRG